MGELEVPGSSSEGTNTKTRSLKILRGPTTMASDETVSSLTTALDSAAKDSDFKFNAADDNLNIVDNILEKSHHHDANGAAAFLFTSVHKLETKTKGSEADWQRVKDSL